MRENGKNWAVSRLSGSSQNFRKADVPVTTQFLSFGYAFEFSESRSKSATFYRISTQFIYVVSPHHRKVFETIKICTGYRLNGKVYDYLPAHAAEQAAVEPIYEEMAGWQETTAGARSWADLPAQAIKYITRVQELIETPVALVSTSPQREDTILVRDPFAD